MTKAPLALFVYNRPMHTRITLESISKCEEADETELFIFADGPKPEATLVELEALSEVRKLIREKKFHCTKYRLINWSCRGVIKIYSPVHVLRSKMCSGSFFIVFLTHVESLYHEKNI